MSGSTSNTSRPIAINVIRKTETTAIVRGSLNAQLQSASGVSLDEESINLLTYQRQFQAAARFITVIDEALQILIGLVLLFTIYAVAQVLDLGLITAILNQAFTYGAFALIVVFYPELRNALARLGRSQLWRQDLSICQCCWWHPAGS